jgi:hypothetical protein
MSEIRLHIVINVVSCLNATEGFRLLSVEEVSLHEFLLNQILLLQESLESSLVPHVVEELLGREVVAPPPSLSRGHPMSSGYGGQGGGGVSNGHLHT